MNKPDKAFLDKLLAELDDQNTFLGVMLVGSGARGTMGRFSDLDLTFITKNETSKAHEKYGLLYRNERLISKNVRSLAELKEVMLKPLESVKALQVLKDAKILRDSPAGELSAIRQNAIDFVWSSEFQKSANREASYELAGNAEELHKILKGLSENNEMALIAGAWGIALSMPLVIALRNGVLSLGDNFFFQQVRESLGSSSSWSRCHEIATGSRGGPENYSRLAQQAIGSAWLYEETAKECTDILSSNDREVIHQAIATANNSGLLPSRSNFFL